jgi:hypothetical protein
MTKPVFVRLARESEGQMFFDWAEENPVNEFDPQVALFPTSSTWCAFDKDGPLAFQTIQRPFMLESLAMRPGSTRLQTAAAMKELTQNAVTQAASSGVGEIYFLGSDESTDVFATNHIFEELPYKAYRVRIKDLE